jgi:hypothetical protein
MVDPTMASRRSGLHLLAALLCLAAGLARVSAAEVISFLNGDLARAAIIDESIEPYFSRLEPREMAAKSGSVLPGSNVEEQRSACRLRYQQAVQDFTADEQRILRAAIATLSPVVARYPLYASQPWSFIKLAASFEGGMPHTRGQSIVLSDRMIRSFKAMGGESNFYGPSILAHEQLHVIQRLHPEPFAHLYTATWGFLRLPHAPVPTAEQRAHQIVNPDGIDAVWAFPLYQGPSVSWIQPQVVLNSQEPVPAMPGDFDEVAYPLVKSGDSFSYQKGADGEPLHQPLHDVAPYIKAFAPSDEIFHPNEIAASLFSLLVLHDLTHDSSAEPQSIAGLRRWAETDLQLTPRRSP